MARSSPPPLRDEPQSDPAAPGRQDIDGWTGFDFPGRGDKVRAGSAEDHVALRLPCLLTPTLPLPTSSTSQYSSFKWNFNHFSGVDWDNKNQKKAIFLIEGKGKAFPDHVDSEHGNYGRSAAALSISAARC